MSVLVESYEHRGVPVKIYLDEDPLNPRQDYHATTIVAWHRRSDLGDPGWNYRDVCDRMEASSREEFEQWLKDDCGAVCVKPLYLYEHSGQTISLRPFGDPWDSGQVGYVFVTQKALDETGAPDAEGLIEAEVSEYDAFLRGEVYGYVVDEGGDYEGSTWGFVGDLEYAKTMANEEAAGVAKARAQESREAAYWAARDVETA